MAAGSAIALLDGAEDDDELITLDDALLALLEVSLAVSLEHATAPKAAIALRLAAAITLR
ncbi:hypothetical protein MARA_17930 [Mycolicibacterium arabiense]|uniref:Uncharacterized protein n=1 Tax=Mycolicibacterium arabiense TaxID=1286181 RepID=A0A7I7RX69_9MYCO|nr:hypothetical protein MARA_17930 [Mycolicibacterium arabiense]